MKFVLDEFEASVLNTFVVSSIIVFNWFITKYKSDNCDCTSALTRTEKGKKTKGGVPKSEYPKIGTTGKQGIKRVIKISAFASAIPKRLKYVKR